MSTVVHNHEARLAEALRRCGVEIGSVGGDHFRRVVAGRLLESDWLRGYIEAIVAARLAEHARILADVEELVEAMRDAGHAAGSGAVATAYMTCANSLRVVLDGQAPTQAEEGER